MVHPKVIIRPSFIHLQVIPNLYDFASSEEPEGDILLTEQHWFPLNFSVWTKQKYLLKIPYFVLHGRKSGIKVDLLILM